MRVKYRSKMVINKWSTTGYSHLKTPSLDNTKSCNKFGNKFLMFTNHLMRCFIRHLAVNLKLLRIETNLKYQNQIPRDEQSFMFPHVIEGLAFMSIVTHFPSVLYKYLALYNYAFLLTTGQTGQANQVQYSQHPTSTRHSRWLSTLAFD